MFVLKCPHCVQLYTIDKKNAIMLPEGHCLSCGHDVPFYVTQQMGKIFLSLSAKEMQDWKLYCVPDDTTLAATVTFS